MTRALHPTQKCFLHVITQVTLTGMFLLLFGVPQHLSGQVIATDECNCLSNGTEPGNGQFLETLTINSNTGETWTLISATNFYDITSPPPPGSLIPLSVDTLIEEVSIGTYEIQGIRVEGGNWSAMVSNGTTTYPVTSRHRCYYPDTTIYGDLGNCIGSIDNYYVDIPDDDLINVQWTLSGGGTIITSDDIKEIEIQWGAVPGTYTLSVDVEAMALDAPITADNCLFSSTVDIVIADEGTTTMACNNIVNLTISGLCELMVTPEMFLESPEFPPSSYDIILRDIEADTIVSGYMIDNRYIDKTLEVTVLHECSYNSCWGYITVEDKAAPPLVCGPDVTIDCEMATDPEITGFPLPPSAIITPLDTRTYLLMGYDPCGDATLTYIDESQDDLCTGPYSNIITRTWIITDENGNTGSCSTVININRTTIDEIVFPDNWDDATGPNPSLEACGNWPMLDSGAPDPIYTGEPLGAICLNAHVFYEDRILAKCDQENIENTFKVLRRWTVRDHCTGRDTSHTQYIAVMDRIDPVVTLPDTFEVYTTVETCAANIKLPIPEVEDCSIWDYGVSYRLKDENGEPDEEVIYEDIYRHTDGSYTIFDIPGNQGEIWVIYNVADACGNAVEETMEVKIIDNQEPVPVCDQYSYVGLDEEGMAWAGVETFDDGSWDNCGIAKYEIRRMEVSACGVTSIWTDKIKFCCADVGNTVMVSLRVTDYAGNSNTCMVEVEVQDNQFPIFTYCPPDTVVDCDLDLGDFSQFGFAEATDNCEVEIDVTIDSLLNSCGVGIINRIFTARDGEGNEISKTQKIAVESKYPLHDDNIGWPKDITLTDGCIGSTDPDDLPSGFDWPIVNTSGCTNIAITYEDHEFQYVEEACFKIIRKWKVIDWCQFNPFIPDQGIYIKSQLIKVVNDIAPDIIQGCNGVQNTEQLEGCNVLVTIIGEATDDCTQPEDLIWRYELDRDNNGIIDKYGSNNDASTILPYGTHAITWTVEDECGNQSTCKNIFTLNDNKPPTPYCLTTIVTVIMGETGDVTIWASDFDRGSTDNCGSDSDLAISFSPDTTDTYKTITCDDLNGLVKDTFEVNIYVTDKDGNNDFCTTRLIIQDNSNYCGNEDKLEDEEEESEEEESPQVARISGAVLTAADEMMNNVSIELSSNDSEYSGSNLTSDNGTYAFDNLPMYNQYSVQPLKDDDPLNGVSTLDILIIQRHILGLEALDNPLKVIAADINNSSSVTSADLIHLRKLILGVYESFPNNQSWRFVDSHQKFDDMYDPFPLLEKVEWPSLANKKVEANFIGVKVGDVNNTYSLQRAIETTSRSTVSLTYSEVELGDNLVQIDFKSTDVVSLSGIQLSVGYDVSSFELLNVTGKAVPITSDNFYINDGFVNLSWNDISMVKVKDKELFSFTLKRKRLSRDATMYIHHESISSEVYVQNGAEVMSLPITLIQSGNTGDSNLIVYQNSPNPFDESTTINFFQPKKGLTTIRVLDITGKLLWQKIESYEVGLQQIRLTANELNAQGILYYQLETDNQLVTKRMVILK